VGSGVGVTEGLAVADGAADRSGIGVGGGWYFGGSQAQRMSKSHRKSRRIVTRL
jgi:hypothetical protein